VVLEVGADAGDVGYDFEALECDYKPLRAYH
jgi:hypothetical protein